MKELELPLIEELLDFYIFYVEGGEGTELKKRAKDINARFHSASAIVSSLAMREVLRLVDFFANTGYPQPTKGEVLSIVDGLKRRREKLLSP